MISRFSLSLFSATLAFAAAVSLHAAPAAAVQAAPADSVTYHIERHGQQVTVKDANEKTLITRLATTQTIQEVFTKAVPNPNAAFTHKKVADQIMFTLEDQTGRRLWSTPVPVVSPNQISFVYNTKMVGSQLIIGHQAEDTSARDQPPFSRLVIVIGLDGRPVSMSDGHKTYNIAISPTESSFTGQDGKVLLETHVKANNTIAFTTPDGTGSAQATGTSVAINLNGTTVSAKTVKKDGKTYLSFPWNGHNVLVEQPCTISFTNDGDLTVNIPSTAKTTASK